MQTDDNNWQEGDQEREGRGLVRVCAECNQSTPLAADRCGFCGKPFASPNDTAAIE